MTQDQLESKINARLSGKLEIVQKFDRLNSYRLHQQSPSRRHSIR